MKSFTLEILTQEKHLLTETISSLTVPTTSGEITLLADHIPLFTRLTSGELSYTKLDQPHSFAVSGGFLDFSPNNIATILADSAVRSEEINLQKVQDAIENAKKALASSPDQKTSLKIEMELRQALLQQKIAKKRQSSR